jgi:hypothetical protein
MLPSLKLGLGLIASSIKPVAGIKPCGLSFIQIVPPVIIISTLLSGCCTAAMVPFGLWWG